MSIARLRIMAIAVALVGSGVAISLLHAQTPPEWKVGDVFVAIGSGKYEVYGFRPNNNGVPVFGLRDTITSNVNPKKDFGGCWFDAGSNMYAPDITNTKVLRYDFATHTPTLFADPDVTGAAPDGHSSSITTVVNGDVLVSHMGTANGGGTKSIVRYRGFGTLPMAAIDTYTVPVDLGGTDWTDLSVNQRKLFYTSRGHNILWYQLETGELSAGDHGLIPITSTTGATGPAYGFRLLPPFDGSGGFIVAYKDKILQLDAAGNEVNFYDVTGEDDWRALNLDPDALTVDITNPNLPPIPSQRHFWAVGSTSGKLYRFNLDSHTLDMPFTNSQPIQTAGKGAGLCVLGQPQTQFQPLQLSNPTGSTQLVDVTAPFGDKDFKLNDNEYSFSTIRFRMNVKAGRKVVAAVSFKPEQSSGNALCTGTVNDDFDCRFPAATYCVPFFNDATATPQSGLFTYQCAFYRAKDIPKCSIADPLTDPNCPFADPHVEQGSTDILSDVILDLTNPPPSVFDIAMLFGLADKGSPRVYRDADSTPNDHHFYDATTAIIDWPALGSGTPNDYSPAMKGTSTFGVCAQIIKPDGLTINSGQSIKIIVEGRTGPLEKQLDGSYLCTGTPVNISESVNSLTNHHVTLAVAGTGANHTLKLYCKTPGNANECFQAVNGQPERIQANVNIDSSIPVDTVNPYNFAVTSVCDASSTAQCSVVFGPTSRQYKVCPSGGGNCGS